jgi:histidinol phosphatase-like enzyme
LENINIFFCSHHPDKGFPGEKPEYKTDCGCQKPKPGLLFSESAFPDLASFVQTLPEL